MSTLINSKLPASPRLALLDLLRGLAVLAMVIFHFCYDLDYFHFVELPITVHWGWLLFQKMIVILFVIVAGMSLGLASQQGIKWPKFWRREMILVSCAASVSLISYWLFPDSWIFFGILHFMALASLLALPLLNLRWMLIVLGLVAIALPWLVAAPIFELKPLLWLGLNKILPITRDYTPLFPWFGLMLIGIFAGQHLGHCQWCRRITLQALPNQGLGWLGRHSLAIYMLHQPLLFAGFNAFLWLR